MPTYTEIWGRGGELEYRLTSPSVPPRDWEGIGLSPPALRGKAAARERGLSFRRECHENGDLENKQTPAVSF